MNLADKYRPTAWDAVVGQDAAIKRLRLLCSRGVGGKAIWISGASGIGKTTVARLLAAEIADEFNTEDVDASSLTTARLRDIERECTVRRMGKGGAAYIVNEAHGLRRDAIRMLLVMLERIPPHVVWVFTTTNAGERAMFEDYDDATPLLSRCLKVPLSTKDVAKAFAERARAIAQSEGLDGKPLESYLMLAKKCNNNLRAMLMEIDAGGMLG